MENQVRVVAHTQRSELPQQDHVGACQVAACQVAACHTSVEASHALVAVVRASCPVSDCGHVSDCDPFEERFRDLCHLDSCGCGLSWNRPCPCDRLPSFHHPAFVRHCLLHSLAAWEDQLLQVGSALQVAVQRQPPRLSLARC